MQWYWYRNWSGVSFKVKILLSLACNVIIEKYLHEKGIYYQFDCFQWKWYKITVHGILICHIFFEFSSFPLINEGEMISFVTPPGHICEPTAIRFKEMWYGVWMISGPVTHIFRHELGCYVCVSWLVAIVWTVTYFLLIRHRMKFSETKFMVINDFFMPKWFYIPHNFYFDILFPWHMLGFLSGIHCGYIWC